MGVKPALNISSMLECYDVTLESGFVLPYPSATKFANASFDIWVKTAEQLPQLTLSNKLRPTVDAWPVLDPADLATIEEYRLAYVLLSHIMTAYVYGAPPALELQQEPIDTVPPSIAAPLLEICEELEVPPGVTFASTVLWNVTKDDEESDRNVTVFSGDKQEHHFNLTSMSVEHAGAKALSAALQASRAAGEGNAPQVAEYLRDVATAYKACTEALLQMKVGLNPEFFYTRIRPMLMGSKSKLPSGVKFMTDLNDPSAFVILHLSGSTGAQSSLFQALDILLGVRHNHNPGRSQFLQEMRDAMPGKHARFLKDIEVLPSMAAFVEKTTGEQGTVNNSLVDSYNGALDALKRYRDEHVKVVTLYAVSPAKRDPNAKSEAPKGTGGSELFSLLKGMREDVKDARIEEKSKSSTVAAVAQSCTHSHGDHLRA